MFTCTSSSNNFTSMSINNCIKLNWLIYTSKGCFDKYFIIITFVFVKNKFIFILDKCLKTLWICRIVYNRLSFSYCYSFVWMFNLFIWTLSFIRIVWLILIWILVVACFISIRLFFCFLIIIMTSFVWVLTTSTE